MDFQAAAGSCDVTRDDAAAAAWVLVQYNV